MRYGTAPADLKNLACNELTAEVTRSADFAGWSRDFLGGAGKPQPVIPALVTGPGGSTCSCAALFSVHTPCS